MYSQKSAKLTRETLKAYQEDMNSHKSTASEISTPPVELNMKGRQLSTTTTPIKGKSVDINKGILKKIKSGASPRVRNTRNAPQN